MTQQEKKSTNPVFYLGITLLVFTILIIVCVLFNPNILERFAELEVWQDVEKKTGVPAKIVGLAFGISILISIEVIAEKIANHGKTINRAH